MIVWEIKYLFEVVLYISLPGSEAKPNQHTHNSTEITIASKNVPNLHVLMYNQTLLDKCVLGKASKKNVFFLVDLSQMWVGVMADSQKRSKPLKTPPNQPENRLFRPKFHLSFSQTLGWVGG